VSTDLDELFALSDRLLVLYRGRIVGEAPIEAWTIDDLGRRMAGAHGEAPVEVQHG